jgi:hypothetical protein
MTGRGISAKQNEAQECSDSRGVGIVAQDSQEVLDQFAQGD